MRARIASLSFFLGSAALSVVWLTLLPILLRVTAALRHLAVPGSPEATLLAHVRTLLPFYLAADLAAILVICFVILHFTLGRPLARTEAAVEQLSRLNLNLVEAPSGGPLLSRIQTALRRMAAALADEQALTRRQIDELRATNERLARTQAELVASERLATVGRLAAGVAHEVGNPLSGILGYLSLLKARAQDPQLGEFVDRIEAEVQRINQIVRGLLDLGRPPQMTLAPLELSPLVDTAAQLVKAGPELRNVRFENEVPKGLHARADAGPLSQVLINLFINAGQAMGGDGTLRVSASAVGDVIALYIDDTGPGLSPEVEEKLFEPFFTTRSAGKGTGLGLAVSLHLVRSMNGDLRAENRPEGGARFILELPAAAAHAAS
ncbi:MAG: two-component sensor histidine kinase [Myxococcaceae bacterium]|nr:two-component sensor histidine kinase [Myxococcaceae bacterium]